MPKRSLKEKKPSNKTSSWLPRGLLFLLEKECFKAASGEVLCFLALVCHDGLDDLIDQSHYPQTKTMSWLASILSFLALKLSHIRRYRADDFWCVDRGLGLFAGLRHLPKATWFSFYSHRVTSQMNRDFLQKMRRLWGTALAIRSI
ncbi:MAG: hypothetical protein OXC61_09740 [Flavobacteriaceae bacterium]|nr:hypothetical protein [Flavobacteriaceae bacterium]